MKFFLAEGRLGNQIFQYVFLKTIQRNNEKIIVSGFEDLKEVFEIDDIVYLNKKNRWIRAFLFRIIKPIMLFLSQKKVINSISIKHEEVLSKYRRESIDFKEEKGLFIFFTFVKLGFFQSEKFFDDAIASQLKLKDIYLNKADKFLDVIPKSSNKIFIHIRRGDYKDYTVYGKSTLLPISYYKEQIDWFLENRKDYFFIFLSDEPEFIEKEFSYLDNKLISIDNDFGTDLAIMTKCNSAILSPSSFGWWGSYLMKNRDIVFAPKYWLGFSSSMGYQANGTPHHAKEIEI